MVSGGAGTGKTSLAAFLAIAACRRGERCLFFSFEESPNQFVRNMRSIGVNLEPWIRKGLLRIIANRPALFGLEMHLVFTHNAIEQFGPKVVVLDPITDLMAVGSPIEVHSMLTRLIDNMKIRGVTLLLTSLTGAKDPTAESEVGISSLIDTWVALQNFEVVGERNRGLSVLKSRGMAHSNLIREFVLSNRGIDLVDVYRGPDGILTGAARRSREIRDEEEAFERRQTIARNRSETERRRRQVAGQIEALKAELGAQEEEIHRLSVLDQRLTAQAGGKNRGNNNDKGLKKNSKPIRRRRVR